MSRRSDSAGAARRTRDARPPAPEGGAPDGRLADPGFAVDQEGYQALAEPLEECLDPFELANPPDDFGRPPGHHPHRLTLRRRGGRHDARRSTRGGRFRTIASVAEGKIHRGREDYPG